MDQSIDTVCIEWGSPYKELIDNDTKRPQVNCVVVRQFLNKLGSHVKWSSLNRCKNNCIGGHRPCEPKITQFNYSICGNENVLWLHISMNNAVRVQIIKCVYQLLCNLSDFILWQISIVLKNFEQFSLSELCDHAEFMGCFEWVKQEYNILVIKAFENVDLLSQIIEFLFSFASITDGLLIITNTYLLVMNLRATTCPEPLRLPL